jgi:hypothetical protein
MDIISLSKDNVVALAKQGTWLISENVTWNEELDGWVGLASTREGMATVLLQLKDEQGRRIFGKKQSEPCGAD